VGTRPVYIFLLRPTSAIWHFSGRKFGRLVSTPLVLLHACCSKWCLTKASLFSSCSMLVLRCESGIQHCSGRPATGQVSWRAGPRATPNPGLTTESLNRSVAVAADAITARCTRPSARSRSRSASISVLPSLSNLARRARPQPRCSQPRHAPSSTSRPRHRRP